MVRWRIQNSPQDWWGNYIVKSSILEREHALLSVCDLMTENDDWFTGSTANWIHPIVHHILWDVLCLVLVWVLKRHFLWKQIETPNIGDIYTNEFIKDKKTDGDNEAFLLCFQIAKRRRLNPVCIWCRILSSSELRILSKWPWFLPLSKFDQMRSHQRKHRLFQNVPRILDLKYIKEYRKIYYLAELDR